MNFDHLSEKEREAFKKHILKLNKADEPRPYIEDEEEKKKYHAIAMRKIYEEQIDKEKLDKNSDPVTYSEAKEQILRNDLAKAAQFRDEYKMQLEAANKEIEVLKSKLRDYQDRCAESFSWHDMNKLQKEIDQLKKWKKEQLTVQSWWDQVDIYVREHEEAPLGSIVANTCLRFLKERDELIKEVKNLRHLNKENVELIEKIVELKKQLANAQDTIVGLRKLREEEKDSVDINLLHGDSKKFQELKHQCTVNWLNETEKRLSDVLHENKELKQALEVFKDIVKKNDYKNAIVQELFTTHLWTQELEDDPWRAIHKIACWHCDLGAYFQKQKTLTKRIVNFYYNYIYSTFWNAYNNFRYGKHNDKWPEF